MGAFERLEACLSEALPELEAAGNDLGLSISYWTAAYVAFNRGRADEQMRALERSLLHAQRYGSPYYESLAVRSLGSARFYGSTPVPELLAWLDAQEALGYHFYSFRVHRGPAVAMLGRFDEGLEVVSAVRNELRERGNLLDLAQTATTTSQVQLLAGNPEAAEEYIAEACDFPEQQGEKGMRSTAAAWRALVLYELDRLDEAYEWAQMAEELGDSGDVFTQIPLRRARAKVLARRGEHGPALELAREAVELAERTDFLNEQADAYADLAEVMSLSGRLEEAADALEHARTRFERKGNVVMAERTGERLAALRESASR